MNNEHCPPRDASLEERAKFFMLDIQVHEDGTYSLHLDDIVLLAHVRQEEVREWIDTAQAGYESVGQEEEGSNG